MRLSVVNLVYPPDLAPSAHLAASLAEHRAALGDQVTVVCGTGSYLGGTAGADSRGADRRRRATGVRVLRVWTPGRGKATTTNRLGDYLSFLVGAVVRLAVLRRQDVIVSLTTPPFVLSAAITHRVLHPRTRVVLWSQDVYPDAAEAFGVIRAGGVASRLLRAINRWLFRRVDHVVALDAAMLRRVLSAYARSGRPDGSVIPSWERISTFPRADRSAPWDGYREPGLAGRFVVLHRGNLGVGHRTDTVAEAAAALADEGVVFLFVGGGTRISELAAEVAERDLENVVIRDYVPSDQVGPVLAGADCTLITLDDRSLGIMSPSKIDGSLAMGIPVVYAGPSGTNVDETIAAYGCGFSLRQGDIAGLVSAIRRLRDDPALAAEMSRNARTAFEDARSDRAALPRFDAILDRVAAHRRPIA